MSAGERAGRRKTGAQFFAATGIGTGHGRFSTPSGANLPLQIVEDEPQQRTRNAPDELSTPSMSISRIEGAGRSRAPWSPAGPHAGTLNAPLYLILKQIR